MSILFDSNIEIWIKHTVIVKNAYDQFKNDINLEILEID